MAEDWLDGARAVARTWRVTEGIFTSVDHAVAANLAWFDEALARGIRWADIIGFLSAAGMTPGGRPLSLSHLSAVYYRQTKRRRAEARLSQRTPTTDAPVCSTPLLPNSPEPRARVRDPTPLVDDTAGRPKPLMPSSQDLDEFRSALARAKDHRRIQDDPTS